MANLYELSTAFQSVENLLTDPDIVLDDETQANLLEALQGIELSFNEKVENTVKFIKNLESQVDSVDEEIKRLQARKKTLQSKSDWLRAGIKGSMIANGLNNVPSALFTITLSKPKDGSVIIECDINDLPDEYKKVKIEADKVALKADLKAGVEVVGCYIEKTQTLTIK